MKRWDVLEVYLDRGWDINSPMEGGNTLPLIKYAVLFLSTDSLSNRPRKIEAITSLITTSEMIKSRPHTKWCIDHGADPMAGNMFRNLEIPSQAAKRADPMVLQILKDGGADFTKSNALHNAATSDREGRVDVMAFLLDEAGVSINMREFEWDQDLFERYSPSRIGTALHYAARSGPLENVKFLVERGADLSMKDGEGRTAADFARERGFYEALPLLEIGGQKENDTTS
ncbi:hypothetical protein M434DRAFT_401072 [Hypoxylon sp. CO27-5]|nr:hypothetical protein M434DRAFT_401072 [Hypoxylon sp. CO27-5]